MDQETVKKIFTYKDGCLFWIKTCNPRAMAGQRAGTTDIRGYRQINIKRKLYYEHRLIFLYHHGYLPEYIDHIDRDKSNNLIENLRESSVALNLHNKDTWAKSGYKGVHRYNNGRYGARIAKNKQQYHLGYFASAKEASEAYQEAAKRLYK